MEGMETVICQICKEEKKLKDVIPAELVRDSIVNTIKKKHPDWNAKGYICYNDLNKFRIEHVQDVLETEKGEVSDLEAEVVKSLKEHEILTKNVNVEFEQKQTFGQRFADKVTTLVGSWTFIISFLVVLFVWIAVNSIVLILKPFDAYPYILLNLVLSCIAAIQAPVIMMSQNRQNEKDRLRSEHDYKTDLKAELEIRHINAKIDQLISHQWQRLLEIQRIQMELMEDHLNKDKKQNNITKNKNSTTSEH